MKEQEIKNGKTDSPVEKLVYESPRLHTQEIDLEYGIAQTSGMPQAQREVNSESREWFGDW